MKNQSFHPRKIRIPENSQLSPHELKNRTIIALSKLGQQRFSDEPGGYSLDNWANGMNILLDDFEEKMGKEKLPQDYYAKRRELNGILSKPVSTTSIDGDITEVTQSMASARTRIKAETERIVSRITELENEQSGCSAELSQEQERISNLTTVRNSESFLRRLIAKNPRSSQDSKGRVDELKARLGVLDQEITEQKKVLRSVEQRSRESPLAEDWKTLESLQTRLEALENERLESVQLVKVREEATASIADIISEIPS